MTTTALLTADMTPAAAAEAIATALNSYYEAEAVSDNKARIGTGTTKARATKLLNSVAPARIRKQAPHLSITVEKHWSASHSIVVFAR